MKNVLKALSVLSVAAVVGCGTTSAPTSTTSETPAAKTGKTVTLSVGSYSVTKTVYITSIFPAFQKYWKAKTGETVKFQSSFDASGAEARSIANGLDVDVAALSLEADIGTIQKAGLITHDWKSGPYKGMVTDSIVAIAVRKGNPKGIHAWSDLTKPVITVDLPNPQTSGGAKWDINAIYGAGLRNGGSSAKAKTLLTAVMKNVTNMDKSGDASIAAFASGVGDAAVSYENSILEVSDNLKKFDEVVPSSTILIENPVALVDKNVDQDGNRAVAQGFIDFLYTKEAQLDFAKAGLRPVTTDAKAETEASFVKPKDLFDITYLGGWSKVNDTIYGDNGIFSQVLASHR